MLALAALQPELADLNADDVVAEGNDTCLARTAYTSTLTGPDQSTTSSAEATAATIPEPHHFPDGPDDTNPFADKPTVKSLRARKPSSYPEPFKGPGTFNAKLYTFLGTLSSAYQLNRRDQFTGDGYNSPPPNSSIIKALWQSQRT